jgi:hypothetical protein
MDKPANCTRELSAIRARFSLVAESHALEALDPGNVTAETNN